MKTLRWGLFASLLIVGTAAGDGGISPGPGTGSSGSSSSSPAVAFTPTPNGTVTTLAVTTTSANVALPTGITDEITNTGSTTIYANLGSSSVTAGTSNYGIAPGVRVYWTPGSATYIAGITSSGTGSLSITGGALASSGGGGTTTGAVSSFQQTVTSTAAALPSDTFTNGVVLTAGSANTGQVCVGGSVVTTATGYCLKAGYSISYGVANSNQIYIVDSTAGDTVQGTGN